MLALQVQMLLLRVEGGRYFDLCDLTNGLGKMGSGQ